MKCDTSKNDSAKRQRASCRPIAPSSLTPIHDGYCQGPDRDHCAPSFYSLEDMRQKKWHTHVKINCRKTNAPSQPAPAPVGCVKPECFGGSHLDLNSEQGTHGMMTSSKHTQKNGDKLTYTISYNSRFTGSQQACNRCLRPSACLCTFAPADRQRQS